MPFPFKGDLAVRAGIAAVVLRRARSEISINDSTLNWELVFRRQAGSVGRRTFLVNHFSSADRTTAAEFDGVCAAVACKQFN